MSSQNFQSRFRSVYNRVMFAQNGNICWVAFHTPWYLSPNLRRRKSVVKQICHESGTLINGNLMRHNSCFGVITSLLLGSALRHPGWAGSTRPDVLRVTLLRDTSHEPLSEAGAILLLTPALLTYRRAEDKNGPVSPVFHIQPSTQHSSHLPNGQLNYHFRWIVALKVSETTATRCIGFS